MSSLLNGIVVSTIELLGDLKSIHDGEFPISQSGQSIKRAAIPDSGACAVRVTNLVAKGDEDQVDKVDLGLTEGVDDSTEETDLGVEKDSKERGDELSEDDGGEHGNEEGEEVKDLTQVEPVHSIGSAIGGGVIALITSGGGLSISGGGGVIRGGVIGGGSVGGSGGSIGGLLIRGGSIGGGGGAVASAISKDSSEESESGDISGHGDQVLMECSFTSFSTNVQDRTPHVLCVAH